MAWLTREDPRAYSRTPKEPDLETLAYWVARLEPLIRCEDEGEIIIVLANRTGTEGDAVYAGTSAVLGIQSGEVKLYGVLGRGERELLVVDTSNRPQAKLVNDPRSSFPEETTASPNSAESLDSKSTQSSLNSLLEPDEFQQSIDEVLAGTVIPVSPVEPHAAHVFFGSNLTKEDRQILLSTAARRAEENQTIKSSKEDSYQSLKSAANVINRKGSSTPAPDEAGVERPSSPKSRNASRTRQPAQQEQALHTHDLAGVEPEARHTPSRNIARGATALQTPHSASDAQDVAAGRGDWEFVDGMLVPPGRGAPPPRPKSTGW